MVERVSTGNKNAYIQNYFTKLPDAQKGEPHTVKQGESLWNIAKQELGKGAKNSEINDYMFLLAKVNGLDTSEKMNNIRINAVIYLPKKEANVQTTDKKSASKQEQTPTNNKSKKTNNPFEGNADNKKEIPGATNPVDGTKVHKNFITISSRNNTHDATKVTQKPEQKTTQKSVPEKQNVKPASQTPKVETEKTTTKQTKSMNPSEQAFADVVDFVMKDESIRLEDSNLYFVNNKDKYYHVLGHYEANGYKSNIHPYMSFTLKENGTISKISYEGGQNTNPYGYDYVVYNNGKEPAKIKSTSYSAKPETEVGTVSQEDMKKLTNRLNSLVQQSK